MNWENSMMVVLRLLSALSKVLKTTVEQMDHNLLNSNITSCIDAVAFAALTGKYDVNKISWAYSLLRQHRFCLEC